MRTQRQRILDQDDSDLYSALERVIDQCTRWAALAPEDDWGNDMADTVLADAGRGLLRMMEPPLRCPGCGMASSRLDARMASRDHWRCGHCHGEFPYAD